MARQGNKQNSSSDASPLLLMARRVREEQGVEQLKQFLSAMKPFAAPNEIRRLCEGFGINFQTLPQRYEDPDTRYVRQERSPQPQQTQQPVMPQMQMLQTLLQMQSLMGSGKPDPMQLIKLMNGGRQ